jgi:hypothetical protein
MFTFSPFGLVSLKPLVSILETTCKLKTQAFFGPTFSPFVIKSPKSPKAKGVQGNYQVLSSIAQGEMLNAKEKAA